MEAPPKKTSTMVESSSISVPQERLFDPILAKLLDEKVTELTSLLSTNPAGSSTDPRETCTMSHSARVKALHDLFSNSVFESDVVLVLPSLCLRMSEVQGAGSVNPLPEVGAHHNSFRLSGTPTESRPSMTASVLTGTMEVNADVEQKPLRNIVKQTCWTKSTLDYCLDAIVKNVCESFSSLVDSRMRAWTVLLLRHSLATGDSESRKRLFGMLEASVSVKKAETTFQTLPLPESAAGQPKEADVILPLLFEVNLLVSVQDKDHTLTLRAPGTISAYFDRGDPLDGLTKAEIRLTTRDMLNAMVEQARIVVLRAVAAVSKAPVPVNAFPGTDFNTQPKNSDQGISHQSKIVNNAGFRSAVNLTATPKANVSLQKARSSALRLNNVLHGKADEGSAVSIGLRKNRSVRWDEPGLAPTRESALAPEPKKPRIDQTSSKLKSFKSFGRPHGGDGESGPRNATFGDYGGRAAMWGRHGRMIHHPTPLQAETLQSPMVSFSPDRNETFDLSSSGFNATASNRTLPRTTTALENFFLKASTGR